MEQEDKPMKIIKTNSLDKNYGVEVERTDEFYKSAKELSEYIISLPLNNSENDRLLTLISNHVNKAERSGFLNGFKIGKEFAEYQAE